MPLHETPLTNDRSLGSYCSACPSSSTLRHLAMNSGMVMQRRISYGLTFNPAFTARAF